MHGSRVNPELFESSNLPETQKDRYRVSGKDFAIGVDWDVVDATYPTPTTEVYTFKLNAAVVRTVQLTYVGAAKKDLLKAETL